VPTVQEGPEALHTGLKRRNPLWCQAVEERKQDGSNPARREGKQKAVGSVSILTEAEGRVKLDSPAQIGSLLLGLLL
jgi:hypothetical protein